MKTLLTGIALSLSALITTSAMAAPQHYDQRYDRPNTPHWSHDTVTRLTTVIAVT